MKWWRGKRSRKPHSDAALAYVRERFRQFHILLDKHDEILRLTADMEEKSQGEFLFDLQYLRDMLKTLKDNLTEAVEIMISMGGAPYYELRTKAKEIFKNIELILPLSITIEEDEIAIPYDKLSREDAMAVGSKNAQLGEMKSKLGLPVPDGFALTAWAYKLFLHSNNLRERISTCISALDIFQYNDLVECSKRIRNNILESPIPDEIIEASQRCLAELNPGNASPRYAMRSSAVGEDTIYSFAGQYATLLNVPVDNLGDAYREVIASKYTPQAIYYFLSHAIYESQLPMSVGCVVMIDAVASGVIYTRSPVDPDVDCVLVSATWGLGKYLVDGRITPDTFCLSRQDGSLRQSVIVKKTMQLVLDAEAGTREEPVPEHLQETPSLTSEQLHQLYEYAVTLEQHYESPQDIEFAIDKEGKIYLLQTRPLRVPRRVHQEVQVATDVLEKLCTGKTTVSPGAGAGEICHVSSQEDLARVSDGMVLVTRNSFPGIITVMTRVNAILTEVGGVANHMATIAREYRVPTISGVDDIDKLRDGEVVTVDATGCAVYRGVQHDIIEMRKAEYDLFSDMAIYDLLKKILRWVAPLHLLHPHMPEFKIENCRTVHDIVRFIHQKATEEMFTEAIAVGKKGKVGLRLKTDMPIKVRLIYLDKSPELLSSSKVISLENLHSVPMKAFWNGIAREGWPTTGPPMPSLKVQSKMSSEKDYYSSRKYRETSFAILSKEYMICNLHMGYHFTTVEAMCTADPDRNYIRIQWGNGGAAMDRRIRRIKLIAEIAGVMGFENYSRADFLNIIISHISEKELKDKLYLVGRLTMLTKQLDMALINDEISKWYARDIMKKIGLVERNRDNK